MNFRSCSRFSAFVPSKFAYLFATLLALLGCAAHLSAQNIINTIAGGGSVAGAATGNYADIPGPTGVVTDAQGNLYVVSPSANQVYKVDPTGTTLSVFAGLGWPAEDPMQYKGLAVNGNLNNPEGLAIDSAGNIYIADTQAYLIREVQTNGNIITIAGSGHYCSNPPNGCGDNGPSTGPNALLAAPAGVATDAAGNVYIADTGSNEIRVVNTQSSPIQIYGMTKPLGPGDIGRVAGNGMMCTNPAAGQCGDGKKGTSASLNGPQGVAIDKLGNMFIADSGDHRVRVMIPSGTIVAYVGTGTTCTSGSCGNGGPASQAQLSNPWQLYVDAHDNLYIADSPTNMIREVTPGNNPPTTAMISTVAGNGFACSTTYVTTTFCGDTGAATAAELNAPRGIFLDSTGDMYIADSGTQRVRKVSGSGASKGDINTYAGGGLSDGPATAAIFAANRDVAVDNAGNIYVADTANNRIRKISGGNVSTVAGNGIGTYYGNGKPALTANLNQPWGLTVDNSGNIYIADTSNLVIRVVNTQSSPLSLYGGQLVIQPGFIATVAGMNAKPCTGPAPGCGDGGPATSATFAEPGQVALDSAGNIFVADILANRIREVNINTGIISTVAGTGTACSSGTSACGDGGLATAAELNGPHSIAVDSAENIYIADTDDNRIRVVDSAGNINAFAFNGLFNSFGPDYVAALQSGYTEPFYVALDTRDNLFVSGSSIYYMIQRVDASTSPIVNPVDSIAGRNKNDPKYFGFAGDGGPAYGAWLDNFGAVVDSSENLYIADGGNNRVREVSSSSTQGLVPVVTIMPNSLTFPPTAIGVQSGQMNFTVANTGSDDLVISSSSISGPFNFVSSSPCSPGNLVAPGMTCVYGVTFTPTGYGVEKGSVQLNDNGFNSTVQNIALSGSGPDFTISANPNSLTVAQGSQGQSTITLTPEAGFTPSITLSCTALPGGTTCPSFVPNPVTMNGTTAQTSLLTVQVGASTAPGTYTINAKGVSATTHTTPITLTVTP